MPEIKAITFDLWDTLVVDDSDEPLRKAAGLRSKKEQRRYLLWEALSEQAPMDKRSLDLAYDVADAAFNRVWHDQHVTWRIAERLQTILTGLNRMLPDDVFARVVDAHERMEVEFPPRLVDGCRETLGELSQRFGLAVVSDAIVTPGCRLREILENHGVGQYFRGFSFSDEVGHSKPHIAMFDTAAQQLGVPLHQIVHIGDRDHNDIRGAHSAGMQAVLFTGSRDVDQDHTSADAICADFADLPGVVERLARR
jgi:putative hydrolase of the HAD superfamily